MVKTLENLGIEGSEGAQVLGALTKNTKLLREQQDIANDSFDEGTSVIDEFNIKNNNTAAIIEKLGKKFTGYFTIIKDGLDPVIRLFGKWFGVINQLEEQLGNIAVQQEKVNATKANLLPLVETYDKLATTTRRTAEQQQEFEKITRQLGDMVPGAVIQWDAYGNAMSVNTGLVRDFADAQTNLLNVMREQQRADFDIRANRLKNRAEQLQIQLNSKKTIIDDGFTVTNRNMSSREIDEARKELAQVQAERMKLANQEREFNGIADRRRARNAGAPGAGAASDPVAPGAAGGDSGGGGGSSGSASGKSSKKTEAEKAADELERLRDELLKVRQQITQDTLTEDAKEIQAAQYKYAQLREKAVGHAEEMAQIDAMEKEELGRIQEKYRKKEATEFDKKIRGDLKAANKAADEKNAFEAKLNDLADEQAFGEVAKVEAKYAALIDQAEAYGLTTVGLYEMMAAEINVIRQKNAADEIKIEGEKQDKIKEKEKKALDESLRLIEQKGQILTNIAQGIGNLFLLLAENEHDYAEFQKTIGLVQLAIDTGVAIASAVRVATTAATNPITLIATIATTVATVTGNILKAKQLIAGSEVPAAPAFRAAGGSTSLAAIAADGGSAPAGWVNRPTLFSLGRRSFVAGEAGAEYVLSNAMLQNPVVADFAGMVEGLRQQNAFARDPANALGRGGGSPAPSMDPQLAETNRLLRLVVERSGLNYSAFEDYRDLVDGVRARATA